MLEPGNGDVDVSPVRQAGERSRHVLRLRFVTLGFTLFGRDVGFGHLVQRIQPASAADRPAG